MPNPFSIEAPDMAGGVVLSKGERSTKPNENIVSQNMRLIPEGGALTNLGYSQPSGQALGESGEGIDGLFTSQNYPDLLFVAVNGKIKTLTADTATAYEADPANTITKDNPVLFREYRGNVYYCNGVENAGRYAIGRLMNAEAAASTTWELGYGEGYKFTNGSDKVYCEGDEADYTAVSGSGTGDNLTTVSNGLAHAAGSYVTQYRSLSAPPSGSLKFKTMAFFRDTMFVSGITDEPNVLRYGKTISSVADLLAGDIHDFSDGNNYIMGEGGSITALHSTRDRLYVMMKDKIFYIGLEVNSSSVESFSTDKLFTSNYGCPNAFCVAEMEDVVVVFTGKRVIRIGYDPTAQQILPSEKFDLDILPELSGADQDQQNARVMYNAAEKKLRVTFSKDNILKTAVYDYRLKKWTYFDDEDSSMWVVYGNKTYFGDRDDCLIYKYGNDLNANGNEVIHILKTGRMDARTRLTKRFIRGQVEGKIARGTSIQFTLSINGRQIGPVRSITDAHAITTDMGTPIGESIIGSDTMGTGGGSTLLYVFRYPFLISSIGEDVQLKWSSFADGAAWQIDKWRVEGVVYDQIPYKHF